MMEQFITKPDVTIYHGIKVDKDTKLEYKNEKVEQTVKDLVLNSKTTIKGEDYKSTYNTTIFLKEGDVLVLEEEVNSFLNVSSSRSITSFISLLFFKIMRYG